MAGWVEDSDFAAILTRREGAEADLEIDRNDARRVPDLAVTAMGLLWELSHLFGSPSQDESAVDPFMSIRIEPKRKKFAFLVSFTPGIGEAHADTKPHRAIQDFQDTWAGIG